MDNNNNNSNLKVKHLMDNNLNKDMDNNHNKRNNLLSRVLLVV